MNDQLHIRSSEAAELARALARETGKTISEVVLEALRRYRPSGKSQLVSPRRVAHWRRLLREDQKNLIEPEIPIEELYDARTGLPR